MDFITTEERNKKAIDFFDRMKANILNGKIDISGFEFDYGHTVSHQKRILTGKNTLTIKYEQL